MMSDPDIDVWAIDEVRFQQHGSRCRMWIAPEEKDPVLLHEPTRKSLGYFGAVRLRDGKFVYRREDNKFNGETFFEFLKKLRKASCQSGKKVVVISDNARYHHAKLHKDYRDQCATRFALDFLPPYSPDLNPIERVWKLTRRCCTHNVYFSTLESIANAVEATFEEWLCGSSTLKRLCAIT
jgi:transposase